MLTGWVHGASVTLALCLQISQSKSFLCILVPKVGFAFVLGAMGLGEL